MVAIGETPGPDPQAALEAERMVEALLFANPSPLAVHELVARLPTGVDVEGALARLAQRHAGRGIVLSAAAGGWRFTTAPDLAPLLIERRQEARRLSKAAYEVLAVIAYHQPATRGEIEDVRGVGLSHGTLDILLELGWVRLSGRRRTPGRPLTYATTPAFLEHFTLGGLGDLPSLLDMRAMGLLERDAAAFHVPDPTRPDLPDEDPVDPAEAGPEFVQDFIGEA